jgi:hypothetical protein
MAKPLQFKVDIPFAADEIEAEKLVERGEGVIRSHGVLDAVIDLLDSDVAATFTVGRMHDRVVRKWNLETIREQRERGLTLWCQPHTGQE